METPAFQYLRLKDLRLAKDVRVKAVAEAAKVSQGTITKTEQGKTIPGSDTLAKIARALDAPMNYFYEEGRDPEPGRSAARMAYAVFADDGNFTVQQRQRCAPAVKHAAAPRTAAGWRAFCQMVDMVLGPPGSQGLELVTTKKRKK